MYLTYDKVVSAGKPCKEGLLWFQRWFPDGGELADVIQHKYVNLEFLHWGYTHLAANDTERDLYWKKVGVDDASKGTCYLSDDVTNSQYVVRSSHVEESQYVFGSKSVFDSEIVVGCDNVENSGEIYDSEFVEGGRRVSDCRNVVRSNNVVASNFVVDSHSVFNASIVTNSAFVGGLFPNTTKVADSMFIAECEDVENCLFCSGQKNGKNLLFNKPVDPRQIELIKKQLGRVLAEWEMQLVDEWPEKNVYPEKPRKMMNIATQYATLPESFWRWVTTLPNYDADVLYSITYNKNI